MEMHWINLDSLEQLPKYDAFLISLKEGEVFYASWSDFDESFCASTPDGRTIVLHEKLILNNDEAFWMPLPDTPKRPTTYLNYK